MPAAESTSPAQLVYVGTYTRSGRSEGIQVFQQNPHSGQLTFLHATAEVDPSFLTFDPRGRFLFAVSEGLDRASGAAASFKIEGPTGRLTPLSHQPSLGGEPCHLACDPTGRWLLVANHEDGSVAVLPIDADGRLGPASDRRQHEGSGPGPTQTGPHAHCVNFDLPGRRVLVADKGIDKVMLYQLDTDAGKLVPNDPPFASVLTVAGHVPTRGRTPRNFSIDPTGTFLYAANQNSDTIVHFRIDHQSGQLIPTGDVTAVGAPVCILFA